MSSVKVWFDELCKQRRLTFEDIPVDVNVSYEGERIRKPDMHVEFGGLKVKYKFELFRVRKEHEVEDGKIVLIGPDLHELPEGSSQPLAVIIEAWGEELKPEYEGVFERKIHYYMNWIQGIMHTGSRQEIWIRVAKNSVKKGLRFEHIGKVLLRLYKADFPMIKKIQVTFITDPAEVEKRYTEALKAYQERDERALAIKDEEVDTFYGCVLCQSFAPTHVCIISPERPANCGAITWLDAKVAAMIDPKGPIFPVPKGEVVDPVGGEYSGANEVAKIKTQGNVTRIKLHSVLEYPHTSCGCFEAIVFYIPEVDGFGIISRAYGGKAPNGLTFIQLANMISGGKQVPGFAGIGVLYLRSGKFLQPDGGWSRVVWMDSVLKERAKNWIPKDLVDKIATEKEADNIDKLREFLQKVNHPVVKRWKEVAEAKPVEKPVAPETAVQAPQPKPETAPALPAPQAVPTALPGLPPLFTLNLKDVKIRIGRVVIKRKDVTDATHGSKR